MALFGHHCTGTNQRTMQSVIRNRAALSVVFYYLINKLKKQINWPSYAFCKSEFFLADDNHLFSF